MATKSYYGLSSQSASIGNANNLTSTGGGASTVETTGNETFNFTGWMELQSHGGSTGVHGAINPPDGRGFLLDTSELATLTTPAGVWKALLTFKSSAATANGDITIRFYDLNVPSVIYTEIGEVTLTGQAITTSGLAVTLTSASLPSNAWLSGHTLYVDIWWNQTGGGSGANLIGVMVSSTSAGVAGASGGFELQIPDGSTTFTIGPATSTLRLTGSVALGEVVGPANTTLTLPTSGALEVLLPTPSIPPPVMPLISEGLPAYASNNTFAPSRVNNGTYGDFWRSFDTGTPGAGGVLDINGNGTGIPGVGFPVWIALDLSSVPSVQRGLVVINLLNEQGDRYPDPTGAQAASLFSDYVLQGNTHAGGGVSAPSTGWVDLLTVTGNTYPTVQHILDLTGYNWLRLSCTKSLGDAGVGNNDVSLQIDIHDAHRGFADRWLFAGDSITLESALHGQLGGGDWGPVVAGALAQLIHNTYTYGQYYPATIDGGFGGETMAVASVNPLMSQFLNGFTGGFVVVAFGTNDCIVPGFTFSPGDSNITTYYAHLLTFIDAALALHNVVIVPYIPWGSDGGFLGTNAQLINEYVDAHLPTDRPTVLRGPDLWTLFNNNQDLIRDGIHPTFTEVNGNADGYELYHSTWAQWMADNVYKIAPIPGTATVTVEASETATISFSNAE